MSVEGYIPPARLNEFHEKLRDLEDAVRQDEYEHRLAGPRAERRAAVRRAREAMIALYMEDAAKTRPHEPRG